MTAPIPVTWRAKDPTGLARTGQARLTPDAVAPLVEKWWRLGWCPAEVRLNGRVIAMIERDMTTGRRIWWAEGAPAAPVAGARFLHRNQITRDSSPKAPGGAVPETCTITAIRGGRVYYQNSTGYREHAALDSFTERLVLSWLPPGDPQKGTRHD